MFFQKIWCKEVGVLFLASVFTLPIATSDVFAEQKLSGNPDGKNINFSREREGLRERGGGDPLSNLTPTDLEEIKKCECSFISEQTKAKLYKRFKGKSEKSVGNRHGRRQRFLKFLKLSGAQKSKLKSMRKKETVSYSERKKNIQVLKTELSQRIKKNATEADLRAIFKKIQGEKRALYDMRFKRLLSIRSILSPDQMQRFQIKMLEKRGRRSRHPIHKARDIREED